MNTLVCASRIALALFFLSWPMTTFAQTDTEKNIASLKQKYPFESIYLTVIALNDLTVHLSDKQKYTELLKIVEKSQILPKLKTFLNSNTASRAFLQIDLANLRAGFKRSNDRPGTINVVSWSKEEVAYIAIFVDSYLNGQIDMAELGAKIRSGSIQISEAWNKLEAARQSPYISTISLSPVLKNFSALIEKKPADVASLKETNVKSYRQIVAFGNQYKINQQAEKPDVITFPITAHFLQTQDKTLLDAYSRAVGNTSTPVSSQVEQFHGLRLEQMKFESQFDSKSR